jgi:O-antigen ligase
MIVCDLTGLAALANFDRALGESDSDDIHRICHNDRRGSLGCCVSYALPILPACALYLVASSVLSVEFFKFDIGGVTLSVARLLLVGMIAGFALRQWHSRERRWALTSSDLITLMFLLVVCASTFTHDWSPSRSGLVPIIPRLINAFLIPFMLYVMARYSVHDERQARWFSFIIATFGVYLAITACCEILGDWSFVYPEYIVNPKFGIHFGRARGPFLQSIRLGIYLTAGLAAIWIPLLWQGIRGRSGRLFGLLLSVLMLVALYLTYTRSVWIGVVVGGLTVSLLTFTMRWRRLVIVGFVCSVVMVAIFAGDGLLKFKREFTEAETLKSTQMRTVFAIVSWQMFQDRPLFGHGFGQFMIENRPYLNDRSYDVDLQMIRSYTHHNTFLSVLAEMGLIGLVLYLAMLSAWARSAWKLWRDQSQADWTRGLSLFFVVVWGTMLMQGLFHEVSYSPVEHGLLFLVGGVVTSLRAKQPLGSTANWGPLWRWCHVTTTGWLQRRGYST